MRDGRGDKEGEQARGTKSKKEQAKANKKEGIESSGVAHLERLLGAVDAAVVHGDADTTGGLLVNLAGLELGEGEATAGADAHVVLDGRATDRGAQEVDRAGCELLGLGGARVTTADLAGGLVEPCADVLLPVLAEVRVLDRLVVLHPAYK
jgi:hypothetical protein